MPFFLLCFFIALNAAFFWIACYQMEVPKNAALNARNGFRTHSVHFSNNNAAV